MLQSMGLQRVRHNWVTELNWTWHDIQNHKNSGFWITTTNTIYSTRYSKQYTIGDRIHRLTSWLSLKSLTFQVFHWIWRTLKNFFKHFYFDSGSGTSVQGVQSCEHFTFSVFLLFLTNNTQQFIESAEQFNTSSQAQNFFSIWAWYEV